MSKAQHHQSAGQASFNHDQEDPVWDVVLGKLGVRGQLSAEEDDEDHEELSPDEEALHIQALLRDGELVAQKSSGMRGSK